MLPWRLVLPQNLPLRLAGEISSVQLVYQTDDTRFALRDCGNASKYLCVDTQDKLRVCGANESESTLFRRLLLRLIADDGSSDQFHLEAADDSRPLNHDTSTRFNDASFINQ